MQIDQPKLFFRKILMLLGVTAILVPLIHYRLLIPAIVYIGALLALHIYIFFVYLSKTNWRQLKANRVGFISRIVGVLFFSYILSMLHYQGSPTIVMLNIVAAVTVHVAILLLLMASRKPVPAD